MKALGVGLGEVDFADIEVLGRPGKRAGDPAPRPGRGPCGRARSCRGLAVDEPRRRPGSGLRRGEPGAGVKPVVSVPEMARLDAKAMETISHDELVERAGHAVARRAISMLGGASGRRVTVLAGQGSNGADGRVAAQLLRRRGAAVRVLPPTATSAELDDAELVIDAAFGTGLSRPYLAPSPPRSAKVLAVDLPSGLDGDTGRPQGAPMRATATVTMAAVKSGLLLGAGPPWRASLSWPTSASPPTAPRWPFSTTTTSGRSRLGHPTPTSGALPSPCSPAHRAWRAPLRSAPSARCSAGAGMVRLVTSGSLARIPLEVVVRGVAADELAASFSEEAGRAAALVLGPGLGTELAARAAVRRRAGASGGPRWSSTPTGFAPSAASPSSPSSSRRARSR